MPQIGKAGDPVTHISQAYPDRVEVRGRDLTGDLMGRLSFTEYFHLLLTGDEPSAEQRDFLDLLLVAIAEHGMMPTNVAARMTLAADPDSLQGAVAAGILGCGPVILGTAEECAKLLAAGGDPLEQARAIRAAGGKLPGFGHPVHKPLDPRAERILELADERSVSGAHVELARRYRDAVAEAWGKPLTMNVSMPIAAVMLDLGFPASSVKAVPILARTASLLAHLAEEQQTPIGFLMAGSRRGGDPLRAMTPRPSASRSPTCASAPPSTATGCRRATSSWTTSRRCRSPRSRSCARASRPTTRSGPTSARRATRSSASTRPAARPARRATSR